MKDQKPKLPKKGGAIKASQIFEQTRKKQPSDGLVKIISEIQIERDQLKKDDRAAKEMEI